MGATTLNTLPRKASATDHGSVLSPSATQYQTLDVRTKGFIKKASWGTTVYSRLRALGATHELAAQIAGGAGHWWGHSEAGLNRVLTVKYFDNLGIPRLSHDLNFSNRLVRTRMPGGVAGAWLTAAPYADQLNQYLSPFAKCGARRLAVMLPPLVFL